jgi:hypothetical protein
MNSDSRFGRKRIPKACGQGYRGIRPVDIMEANDSCLEKANAAVKKYNG